VDEHEALLRQGLTELDLSLSPAAAGQLLELARLLAQWAPRINLTGHRDLRGILQWLVLDAIALSRGLPAGEFLLDLGSGAGFPGLPLAIVDPQRQVTLLDSRRRRHHFQRAAIRHLGLSNVQALLGRSEELCEPRFHVVVAQALAAPQRALDLMIPWLVDDGWVALAAGPSGPGRVDGVPGLGTARTNTYRIPTLDVSRSVWIAQRVQ